MPTFAPLYFIMWPFQKKKSKEENDYTPLIIKEDQGIMKTTTIET